MALSLKGQHEPSFIYKGCLLSKTIMFFVSTTNRTNDTNPTARINERRRSPNKANLASKHSMLMSIDLLHL